MCHISSTKMKENANMSTKVPDILKEYCKIKVRQT
jgi:hypothetical protein